jgi:hypothetical protein
MGIDLHVLMEYNIVSLDKIKFLYNITICIISAHLFATGIALCRLSVFFSARVMVGLASPPLEAGAWRAVGRRPLGRRLPPREPLRVCPRRRDRAEH